MSEEEKQCSQAMKELQKILDDDLKRKDFWDLISQERQDEIQEMVQKKTGLSSDFVRDMMNLVDVQAIIPTTKECLKQFRKDTKKLVSKTR